MLSMTLNLFLNSANNCTAKNTVFYCVSFSIILPQQILFIMIFFYLPAQKLGWPALEITCFVYLFDYVFVCVRFCSKIISVFDLTWYSLLWRKLLGYGSCCLISFPLLRRITNNRHQMKT